jgi:hypothetical protein
MRNTVDAVETESPCFLVVGSNQHGRGQINCPVVVLVIATGGLFGSGLCDASKPDEGPEVLSLPAVNTAIGSLHTVFERYAIQLQGHRERYEEPLPTTRWSD